MITKDFGPHSRDKILRDHEFLLLSRDVWGCRDQRDVQLDALSWGFMIMGISGA